MTENKWKKMISLVDTMGDWGGYQLYEWFKLFPEQRETALREYIYLKAHLIRGCMAALKKDLTQEDLDAMWDDVERFAAFVAQKRREEKEKHD